ncbi:MAG: DUF378 domain-containing protein [Candidatus Eisenbacteria bacterium]|nr:DUF378 domain-containing protein [Candidatus Eisenbacteria bacterium]
MKALDAIAIFLLLIGGINWRLVGFFDFDLISSIFGGADSAGARVIFAIVGLAAIYRLVGSNAIHGRICVDRSRLAEERAAGLDDKRIGALRCPFARLLLRPPTSVPQRIPARGNRPPRPGVDV